MTRARTDYALPAAVVSDSEIANLAAELERRKALKAAQDEENARLNEIAEQEAQQEQARRDAEEAERQRLQAVVDKAAKEPMPSGLLLVENGLDGIVQKTVDVEAAKKRFGAVVKTEGPLSLPVVTCCGQLTTIKAEALKVHRVASQLVIAGSEGLYLMAYRVAVREAWDRAVAAEVERTGEGLSVILYTAALPVVTVEKDELNPSLVRIVGSWGDCFAYKLPHL